MKTDYIGYALFVISLAVSYYFYLKSIRNKEPVYSIKSNNIISDFSSKYEDLMVIFKSREIRSLTVSKIIIYNRGAETITKDDIKTANQLQVGVRFLEDTADRFDLLDISVLQANCPANQFSVTFNKEEDYHALIDFDYLDKNQGAVIQVFHTGTSSNDINVVGNIKGVQKLIQVPPEYLVNTKPMKSEDKRIWGVAILLAVVFINSISKGGYLNLIANSTDNPFKGLVQTIAFIGAISTLGLVVSIGINILSFITGLFVPSNEIPEGLEKFAE